MSKFLINGQKRLSGQIEIDACKNSILPIMAGSILCDGKVVIKNCPPYVDVLKMCEILKKLGSKITFSDKTLVLDNSNLKPAFLSNDLTKDIRASIFALGPMLARFGVAKVSFPGGCAIGKRGIDIHLKSFRALGVQIVEEHGYVDCVCKNLTPQEVFLDIPSVGATENLMMFACAVDGRTTIHNCAKEPEIVDLQNFLNKMGGCVYGAGSDRILIDGRKKFLPVEFSPIPDRIIAGTMMIACAMTKGDLSIKCQPEHLQSLTNILQKSGCQIESKQDFLHIRCDRRLSSFDQVSTMPYPGFATDLQSQLTTLAALCSGVTVVKENIFDSRFNFVPELIKMGANIKVLGNVAVVCGKENFFGADVYATDLRGGASLVLAGLAAKGYTTVHNAEIVDRGYFELENQLKNLGGDVERIEN